jgi:hypothetical protein
MNFVYLINYYLLKINDTLTAIMSGLKSRKVIATFDWTTMTYKQWPVGFTYDRYLCSCGLLKTKSGQLLVAVAGN